MNTTSTALSVGKETVCYCSKCKMDLGHTITSMVGGLPSRVICRTCKSPHNYKPKKGIKDPGNPGAEPAPKAAKAAREPKAPKVVPVELEWMKQINSSPRAVRAYAANESFKLSDRIAHPTFGEGVVLKLIHPNKMEIIFRSDIKILIHAAPQKA